MNSHVIHIVVIAFLAWDHLSYVAADGDELQSGGEKRGGETHQNRHKDSDEHLAKYCVLQKAEQKTFDLVSEGFEEVFSLLRSLMKIRCSSQTFSKKDRKDVEWKVAATNRKTCELFSQAAIPSFGSISKVEPKSANAVRKALKIALSNFENGTNLIFDAINLQYSKDPKYVVYKIDSIEPDSIAMFLTAISQFFIAMRQGTPGRPVIQAVNEKSEQLAVNGTLFNFRGLFLAIRLYLRYIYYGPTTGKTTCHSPELQEIERSTIKGVRRAIRAIFDEIKDWAGVPSQYDLGEQNYSCDTPSKPR